MTHLETAPGGHLSTRYSWLAKQTEWVVLYYCEITKQNWITRIRAVLFLARLHKRLCVAL